MTTSVCGVAVAFGVAVTALMQTVPVLRGEETATSLDPLRQVYEEHQLQIAEEHQQRLSGLGGRYADALDRVIEELTGEGDPEAVLAADGERARFQEQGTVPDSSPDTLPPAVKRLQSAYRKAAVEAEAEMRNRTTTLTDQYVRRLDQLMRAKTAEGKLEDAVRVKREIQRLRDAQPQEQAQRVADTARDREAAAPTPDGEDTEAEPVGGSAPSLIKCRKWRALGGTGRPTTCHVLGPMRADEPAPAVLDYITNGEFTQPYEGHRVQEVRATKWRDEERFAPPDADRRMFYVFVVRSATGGTATFDFTFNQYRAANTATIYFDSRPVLPGAVVAMDKEPHLVIVDYYHRRTYGDRGPVALIVKGDSIRQGLW